MGTCIKITEREAVDLFGDFLTQAVGDLLCDTGHRPSLQVSKHSCNDIDAKQCQQNRSDGVKVNTAGMGILGNNTFCQFCRGMTENLWGNDGTNRTACRKDQNQNNLEIVRFHI